MLYPKLGIMIPLRLPSSVMVAVAMLGWSLDVDREPWPGSASDRDKRNVSGSSMMESSTNEIRHSSDDVSSVNMRGTTLAALKSSAVANINNNYLLLLHVGRKIEANTCRNW